MPVSKWTLVSQGTRIPASTCAWTLRSWVSRLVPLFCSWNRPIFQPRSEAEVLSLAKTLVLDQNWRWTLLTPKKEEKGPTLKPSSSKWSTCPDRNSFYLGLPNFNSKPNVFRMCVALPLRVSFFLPNHIRSQNAHWRIWDNSVGKNSFLHKNITTTHNSKW